MHSTRVQSLFRETSGESIVIESIILWRQSVQTSQNESKGECQNTDDTDSNYYLMFSKHWFPSLKTDSLIWFMLYLIQIWKYFAKTRNQKHKQTKLLFWRMIVNLYKLKMYRQIWCSLIWIIFINIIFFNVKIIIISKLLNKIFQRRTLKLQNLDLNSIFIFWTMFYKVKKVKMIILLHKVKINWM